MIKAIHVAQVQRVRSCFDLRGFLEFVPEQSACARGIGHVRTRPRVVM